jgi:hypothetical protein
MRTAIGGKVWMGALTVALVTSGTAVGRDAGLIVAWRDNKTAGATSRHRTHGLWPSLRGDGALLD